MEKEKTLKQVQQMWEGRSPEDMRSRPIGTPKQDFDISHYDPAPLGADIESEIQKYTWRHNMLPRRVLVPPRYYVRDKARELGVEIMEVQRIIKLYIGPRPEYENKRRPARGGRPRRTTDNTAGEGGGEVETSGHEGSGSVPVSGSYISATGADSSPSGKSQDIELGHGGD